VDVLEHSHGLPSEVQCLSVSHLGRYLERYSSTMKFVSSWSFPGNI
jgi:hypothetical protein